MSKRPSNLFLKAIIAIASIFGIYILGSWLLQLRPNADDSDITEDVSQVHPYIVSEFKTNYDLDWDASVQQQIEADYSEKPVFVADEVYPSCDDFA